MLGVAFQRRSHVGVFLCLCAAIIMNAALWYSVRDVKTQWSNVPPAPSFSGSMWASLSDPQFAYRTYGVFVQNMGFTGGRVTAYKDYDYEGLGRWFQLSHKLDSKSDFMPFLAGYSFSASQDPQKLKPVIDYLEVAAGNGEGQKWRFLAQAAFLARFKMDDLDRALELAEKLANIENPEMAVWAKQMPVFVLTAQGEKEAAYNLMVSMLHTEAENLHPNEVNAMVAYICEQILSPDQIGKDPLCKDFQK